MKKMLLGILMMFPLFATLLRGQSGSPLMDDLGPEVDMVVAWDGSGDYITIQGAIDATPDNSSERTVVFIKKGTYREKILVGSSKRNLTLVGEDVDSTVLVYDDYAGRIVDGVELNTFTSQTIRVNADDFRAMNMTFENDARPGGTGSGQNVAIATYGARAVLLHCRLVAWQDTYYTGSGDRHYLKDCYIEGAVDYIFGQTTTIFDSCQIQTVRDGGYITAASTEGNYQFGYVFIHCRITAPPGTSGVFLGRPWKNAPRTVFYECVELDNISPMGWRSWNADSASFYAEYNCTGPGSDTASRVEWSHQLTEGEAQAYTIEQIFSAGSSTAFSQDWDPGIENDVVWNAVRAQTVMFLDSINTDARIASLAMNGEPVEGWDPSVFEISVEIGSDPQQMPELTASAVNPLAKVNITYPEMLPGFAEITVLANDGGTHSTYRIYFSVDGSYTDATLDSIRIAGETLGDFSPEVYEYDVVLPADVSMYWGLTGYAHIRGARVITTKPPSLPGTATIEVTAVDGITVATYVLNISLATGIEDPRAGEAQLQLVYPVTEQITFRVHLEETGPVRIRIHQLNGTLVRDLHYQQLPSGTNQITLPAPAGRGIYIYEVIHGRSRSGGSFYR